MSRKILIVFLLCIPCFVFFYKPQGALACSGRLNLCSKTRELTDNQPKYIYRRQSIYSPKGGVTGGGAGETSAGAKAAGRDWGGEEDPEAREAGGATGASYRDVGDRLYSEWKEGRKRHARRRKVEASQEPTSEGWSCPQCGVENRQARGGYEGCRVQTAFGSAILAFTRTLKRFTWSRYVSVMPSIQNETLPDGGQKLPVRPPRQPKRHENSSPVRCKHLTPNLYKPKPCAERKTTRAKR